MSETPTPEYLPPDDEDAGPRQPNGAVGDSHDTRLANEALAKKRWGRWLGLGFIIVSGLMVIVLIVAIVRLADVAIRAHAMQQAIPSPLSGASVWAQALAMLPIFSLSLFALLMFITLARFATDFINEEKRGGSRSSTDDGSDEAAAIRVIKKILALCGDR